MSLPSGFKYLTSFIVAFLLHLLTVESQTIEISKNNVSLSVTFNSSSGAFDFILYQGETAKLTGLLGYGLDISEADIGTCTGLSNCFTIGNDTRMRITSRIDNGFTVLWKSTNTNQVFTDCINLQSSNDETHWYGGPQQFVQYWPVEKYTYDEYSYVIKENDWNSVAERYWVNSKGAYIFVDDRVPLFIDQNSKLDDTLCFIAKQSSPYIGRSKILLNYTITASDNVREAHIHSVQHFLGKPKDHPQYSMIARPIWSTWARYKRTINDSILLEYAQEIVANGFSDGQFEIDDYWETCYGSKIFNTNFNSITSTVETIKNMGFRVTLWTHPFVNVDCETIYTGIDNGLFARSISGSMNMTWWNSDNDAAHLIDFTNPEAREWFADSLRLLQINHGIDSFKFDAGETFFAPEYSQFTGDVDRTPNVFTEHYVKTCAQFGNIIEVRSAWRTQEYPIFVRMLDKDSHWNVTNGLYTLITALLTLNLNGYSMVLPDMVGGNGWYGSRPDAELYVRWMQANTFMPAMQFSFVPWDYTTVSDSSSNSYSVVSLAKTYVELHEQYADYIVECMEKSIQYGYPVNAPIWWVDPENEDTFTIDDEYMLGEDLLVAPVIEEGAESRSIYLPDGTWIDGNDGRVYQGRNRITYQAPINILPYFVRQGSSLDTTSA